MTRSVDVAARFLALHQVGRPLLLPNPWDAGSARLLASAGFDALATTSSGFAATLGRLDGSVTRAEALGHAAAVVAATELPVSADLENGFAAEPAEVARTVRAAAGVGLAGCSIEDASGEASAPIYDFDLAVQRVEAAADAAHDPAGSIVLTARAENYLHGRPDLADTIARVQAFRAAGADVVYAPGLRTSADIAALVAAVDCPVNVLLLPGGPSVAELTGLGVQRISLGGTFAYAALGALVEAAHELRSGASAGFFARAAVGRAAVNEAFAD